MVVNASSELKLEGGESIALVTGVYIKYDQHSLGPHPLIICQRALATSMLFFVIKGPPSFIRTMFVFGNQGRLDFRA